MRTSALIVMLAIAAPAFAQRPNQGEDESATFVEEGRAALRRGDLGDAARALDQAITLNPRRVEAYVLRSAVFAAKNQYKDGIALLRKAQALAPADTAVLTALGSQLVLSGDPNDGVPLLEQVVAKEPTRYDAQVLLGHHWHDVGRWQDAVTALEAYFASRPTALAGEDAKNRVELADSYLRARQAQKALALFEQAAASSSGAIQLRARLGAAWATAAIDCKRARPLLAQLDSVAPSHPEIWLVDGQCALSLGDAAGALALGRRFIDRGPKNVAAGHALVGEAQAARGNLVEARKELETARALEPQRRRWTVRLATVLRRAGHVAEAAEAMAKLGPPATPSDDPEWWAEAAEEALAQGDAAGAVKMLEPVIGELATDSGVQTVYGAALLASNQPDAAVKALDAAESIQSTPRSRKLLATALATVGVAKLGANDAAGAETVLARADQLGGDPAIWRDLGIARLAANKPADAIAVLDRAAKADASPITAMLDARAHAMIGDVAGARPIYERALAAERDTADGIEISLDWAASELAGGDPAVAVTALEKTDKAAKSGPLANRHRVALATARHAAALKALEAGNAGKAVELLRAATAADPTLARKCDLAVATVAAGDVTAAIGALRALAGQTCPFPPPADTQAVPILNAFVDGLVPRRAARALDKLTALGAKATGPAAALLGTAIRVVALDAAQDAYHDGQLAQARKYLAIAKAANAHVGADELAHNLAVIDLADGHVDAAIGELERLTGKVPEAWVNLGIAYERKGDQQRAIDAWQHAKKAGVRFAPLPEWIDAKERIYGGAK
ncbi:MAG TPA: tetratricopeptide repeat protein [Kofleriaceae bacterium]|jgi:tetratricopeptide (TPR) repeat protein